MAERELIIPGTSISPFRGKIPPALEEMVLEYGLDVIYSDRKCLILQSPISGRYLKYVVHPETHEPLNSRLQSVVLRGLRNQQEVSDLPGVQKVFSNEFYQNIPGLFELEFVEGTPLKVYTDSDSIHRLNPEEIECVALSMYSTILNINQRGIMHRDVKPGNIIVLTPNLETKFIDWSLSTDIREHQMDSAQGTSWGTVPYFRIDNDAFPVRDRYGLGLTLLQVAASTDERYAFDRVLEERMPIERQRKIDAWTEHTLHQVAKKVPRLAHELLDVLLHPREYEESARIAYYAIGTRDTTVLSRRNEDTTVAECPHARQIVEDGSGVSGLSDSSVSN
ncbi:MAG: hypothetical protein Q7R76_05655 [Candidatus Woesearchaeota archaeon]|nr:hypothetical protein [Candidatus Woesearchaeota archaeon]